MNTVRILPEKVASQIAAGEIVERPSSVVRELVDNSIDAGADRISVSLERGGKRLIRVRDNGKGMSRDDLLLSVERHATSKIESVTDLFSVKTLGFRGEALPSIGAVSRMEIVTRLSGEIAGNRLKISGGKFLSVEETGAPDGTAVEVRDLFFNVSARRKFLRAPGTETGHVADWMARVSIPFPKIGFRLEEEGRILLDLPATEHYPFRLSALLGRDVAESMVYVEEERRGAVAIKAYLAPSEFSRSRGDRLFVYVNGRNIRDRLVNRAVMKGFGQRLMKGQYPQAVVFLDLDPAFVDVNVHPTKQEVRFRDAQEVFQAVSSTIERALHHSFRPVPSLWGERKGNGGERTGVPGEGGKIEPFHGTGGGEEVKDGGGAVVAVSEGLRDYERKQGGLSRGGINVEGAGYTPPLFGAGFPRVIGQLANTYILCQIDEDLLIVDQHAAHERILFEKLKSTLRTSGLQVQSLLVPLKMDFSVKDARALLDLLPEFSGLGIKLEHFGGNTFLLRAVPSLLKVIRWESFLTELAAEMEKGPLEKDLFLEKVLSIMACHGAIRSGQELSGEEMSQILNQLQEADLPANCPHGRPVFNRLKLLDLERMFKRVL